MAGALACPLPLQQLLWAQVAALRAQTAPLEGIVADYTSCLQHNRELEVRCGVLGREVAELRDEAASLHTRLAATDEAGARDFATRAESYKTQLQRANSELTSLLRDKSKAYEELLSLQRQVDALKASQEESAQAAELAATEITGLKARLAELGRELDTERAARIAAAEEAESRVAAKVAAEAEADRLRADNQALDACLKQLMAKESERLDAINRMHEEMMDNAKRQQVEAGAAAQLFGLLTRRRSSVNSSSPTSGTTTPSRRGSNAAAAAAAAADAAAGPSAAGQQAEQQGPLLWGSLKQRMGLPEVPVGALPERQLPTAPVKTHQSAHPGGVCSLEFQRPGHLLASCGLDKTVQTWDLNLNQHVTTFHGLLGSANDVAFTSDGRRLLGAGGDKRLLLWNTATGQVVHTLTGHANAVSCVCCSPLDDSNAVSAGEDRCIKVWDLNRGYSSRSLPCAKMPTALTLSADGQTLVTGHLDGTLCLWDLRCSRAGSQPLAEVRDHASCILCARPTPHADRLLTAAKDNSLRLWDFRQLGTVQLFRAPHFSIGSLGAMGRATTQR